MEGDSRLPLIDRAIRLEYATVGWNVVEAVVAIAAGWKAASIALVGFGLDSVIESISGSVLLWRLRWEKRQVSGGTSIDPEVLEAKEKSSLRIVGWTFFLLSGYVLIAAVRKLWLQERPETSIVGIILLCLSAAVMPLLAKAKFATASKLGSDALRGDAKETLVCTVLSVITLAGIVLNGMVGWWWSDPVAAIALIPWIAKEGLEMVRGKCC